MTTIFPVAKIKYTIYLICLFSLTMSGQASSSDMIKAAQDRLEDMGRSVRMALYTYQDDANQIYLFESQQSNNTQDMSCLIKEGNEFKRYDLMKTGYTIMDQNTWKLRPVLDDQKKCWDLIKGKINNMTVNDKTKRRDMSKDPLGEFEYFIYDIEPGSFLIAAPRSRAVSTAIEVLSHPERRSS